MLAHRMHGLDAYTTIASFTHHQRGKRWGWARGYFTGAIYTYTCMSNGIAYVRIGRTEYSVMVARCLIPDFKPRLLRPNGLFVLAHMRFIAFYCNTENDSAVLFTNFCNDRCKAFGEAVVIIENIERIDSDINLISIRIEWKKLRVRRLGNQCYCSWNLIM